MSWKFKQELGRKFIHLLSISIIFIYFIIGDIFNTEIAMMILVFILIISIEFEYLRLELPFEIPVLKHIWKHVRRKKEKNMLGGDVFFLIGAIMVLSIFNVRIAITAILMTTFGDMVAALVGQRFHMYPVKKLKDRHWEGILAEVSLDLLIGSLILFWPGVPQLTVLATAIIILVMSLTATFVETVIYKLDDNLLIPLFSGFNGQMLFLIFRL